MTVLKLMWINDRNGNTVYTVLHYNDNDAIIKLHYTMATNYIISYTDNNIIIMSLHCIKL